MKIKELDKKLSQVENYLRQIEGNLVEMKRRESVSLAGSSKAAAACALDILIAARTMIVK